MKSIKIFLICVLVACLCSCGSEKEVIVNDLNDSIRILTELKNASQTEDKRILKKYKNYLLSVPLLLPQSCNPEEVKPTVGFPPFSGKTLTSSYTYQLEYNGKLRPLSLSTFTPVDLLKKWCRITDKQTMPSQQKRSIVKVRPYYIADVKISGPVGSLVLEVDRTNDFGTYMPCEVLETYRTITGIKNRLKRFVDATRFRPWRGRKDAKNILQYIFAEDESTRINYQVEVSESKNSYKVLASTSDGRIKISVHSDQIKQAAHNNDIVIFQVAYPLVDYYLTDE